MTKREDSYNTKKHMAEKIKVVLGQLGSPKSTKVSDVREFLREFLGDQVGVEVPLCDSSICRASNKRRRV
jgi:protoheme ferro-lyase